MNLDYKDFSDEIEYKKMPEISILILNIPTYGFGDVIFAQKLKNYLLEWYDFVKVKIATTYYDTFLKIGENEEDLIKLERDQYSFLPNIALHEIAENDKLQNFDLIFVAPLSNAENPDEYYHEDLRRIIPYSNKSNTFIFSEYNDKLTKDITFQTGIGDGRLGMLFTSLSKEMYDINKGSKMLDNIYLKKDNYAVCYIAPTVKDAKTCYISFLNMISKKYVNNKFDVVIPENLANKILKDVEENKEIFENIHKNYSKIILVKNDSVTEFESESYSNSNKLVLRADILPLKYDMMIMLMIHSVNDILVTGDQSLTDVLSCCPDKNIWYQIAPWKTNFAHALSENIPNEYYQSIFTSCGVDNQINIKYQKFIINHDFRKLAKPKLNQIFNMTVQRKNAFKFNTRHKLRSKVKKSTRAKKSTNRTKKSRSRAKKSTNKTKKSSSRAKKSTNKTKKSSSRTKKSTNKTKKSSSRTKKSTNKTKKSRSRSKK
jgi:hypothetical protein